MVQLEVQELTIAREAALVLWVRVSSDLVDANGALATGIVYAGTDAVGSHSQTIGPHSRTRRKGVGPELIQHTLAALLSP